MKKNKVIQIRICEEDKDKIRRIKTVEHDFNISSFLRKCLNDKIKTIGCGISQLIIGG